MTDNPNNHAHLRGRLSSDPAERVLPSGDVLVTFRLVVPRSGAVLRRSKQRVDVVECAAWTKTVQRAVNRFAKDDHVEVTGSLRRRFANATSWFSIDLATCTKDSVETGPIPSAS